MIDKFGDESYIYKDFDIEDIFLNPLSRKTVVRINKKDIGMEFSKEETELQNKVKTLRDKKVLNHIDNEMLEKFIRLLMNEK